MNSDLKNRPDLSELQKEAIHIYHNSDIDTFNKWISLLPSKEQFMFCKLLNIGIYKCDNPVDMIATYMPRTIIFKNECTRHYFNFNMSCEDESITISYKHFLSEDVNDDAGGRTDTWVNPFENNIVCNYLVERIIKIEPVKLPHVHVIISSDEKSNTSESLKKCLLEMYEFLINNNLDELQ